MIQLFLVPNAYCTLQSIMSIPKKSCSPSVSTEHSDATVCSVSGPDSIGNLMIKANCRKNKIQQNFTFPEVDIKDESMLKDLKCCLAHKLPVFGTGRRYGFQTDVELQKLIDSTLHEERGV